MTKAKARAIQWDMKGFLQQCITVYLELAGSHAPKLRKVVSPFIEQRADSPEEAGKAGALAPVASKILMKILYAARMARPDLLRATCYLATRITKWTPQCDKMLYRLVCYIHSSLDYFLHGWIGDDPQKLELCLYTDADFAGDPDNARSTSGVYLCLRGPNSFVPLGSSSKRQTCVSHSTPEAEIVAADFGLRSEGLPAITLWETILRKSVNFSGLRTIQLLSR
jgi:hypothetical protein